MFQYSWNVMRLPIVISVPFDSHTKLPPYQRSNTAVPEVMYEEKACTDPLTYAFFLPWARRSAETREIDNSNNTRFLDFTICLPNFVYWIGFVTGIAFTTSLWIVEFITFSFFGKSAFKSGLLFLRDGALFSNWSFFRVFGRTLIPECAYRP